ncbi:MAG: alpha-E domain-containing protein [Rubrivivax sp.]|nr:alpha-E domain-containing protein [Rubrivivax sp.]
MLSRTADHLFWMARYMERAVQAQSACDAVKARQRASARGGVFGKKETEDVV